MASISKPFEALATKWRSSVFFHARLKLTILYLLVMLVVTTLFSVTLYFNISSDIKESLSHSLRQGVDPDRIFEENNHRILTLILLVDGSILLISSAASYVFAGYTLKPINAILSAQERFTADAAHELRTPLAVIQAQIEVLLRGREPLSAKTKTGLVSMLEETKSLTDMTRDLLLVARQNGAVPSKSLEAILLAALVVEVVESLSLMIHERDMHVTVEERSDLVVSADREGLRRIFMNVIVNALKYTPAHGQVRIAFQEDGSRVCVSVKDTGQGISKEHLPHVFERFYKADNARQSTGTGLGLSIVKELVESYGGSISIQSQIGRGTAVIMKFKRA